VLNREKLEAMKWAALRDDWPRAGDLYLDIREEARTVRDQFEAGALAPFFRLRDVAKMSCLINNLLDERAESV
jgi:hypothetical protein